MPSSSESRNRPRTAACLALVAAATLAALWPVLSNGFVYWDDDVNFLTNPSFRGLGWTQLRWMFSSTLGGHYIPLTWLTLGADYEVWGMDPFGYHLTNLAFHTANALVLFFFLRRLTRLAVRPSGPDAGWRLDAASACGALLFALHPLRVESVAWITERRDMVSGFFGLLFLLTYLRWAEAPARERAPRRAACLTAFILTALARPNCVTLLGAAFILDFYPLRRFSDPRSPQAREALREKLPFLLPAAAGVAAVLAANHATGTLAFAAGETPLERLTQLSMGLHLQVAHFCWPVGLSPVYGLSESSRELWGVLIVHAAVPVALTVALLAAARRWPAGLAAWAYYLLMLLPAHGSVDTWSVTNDRYSYLASLAWSALAAGGLYAAWGVKGARRALVVASVFAVLVVLGAMTRGQCAVWHDTISLWTSAAAADSRSPLPYLGLGRAYLARGDKDASVAAFREGLRLYPRNAQLQKDLAAAERRSGTDDAASLIYRGAELLSRGDYAGAVEPLEKAARLDPASESAQLDLGNAYAQTGRLAEALTRYETVLRLNPRSAEANYDAGLCLTQLGRRDEAAAHFARAHALDPRLLTDGRK
jgi:tetratricopeptide (TPR) repeat protein